VAILAELIQVRTLKRQAAAQASDKLLTQLATLAA